MVLCHFQDLRLVHSLCVFLDIFRETRCHHIVDTSHKHKCGECLGDLTCNWLLSDYNNHGCDKHERSNKLHRSQDDIHDTSLQMLPVLFAPFQES